ncbi:type 1 glutamine amidotransferase domain-containing protein [Bordetella holmesii]|uniref:DJ-1/PfpI family protein n=2 Tax=Bordetella holmesii TaxID=35814 RepID=A0A158M922_9BORD|nr:type 1 glutamine amidotransferase domain-containing protein [Bordetella holmesii]AIT26199.1 DJ-1/PfpI family protein [Bordetella holmesii 44057]EWM43836.1 DJ-1/PfpI family protein [Bordetella holmesii 41130]EWM46771.1 DJ-1/PfpI family protein [Bordetella holmesii 35009]AMD45259.1 thiamine biosynthesis protein ThiJ [Bordetella holmesii H558]AOB34146.1 thiamine biosynthesis protein ThiJ [Bordetella holmesii]
MPRIAFLVTSANAIDLKESSAHPTGYWAEEALKSYERFVAAGFDVVVLTPDGNKPVPDPYGLEHFFHYPDVDRDYFASVYRTFHHDPDDIRITLHHTTEQELVASRRLAERLVATGSTPQQAHELLSKAAKIAWRQKRLLSEVMLQEGMSGGLPESTIRAAIDELKAASQAVADERAAKLAALTSFNNPVALSSLTDAAMAEFDALFVPGGHGPMVDLPDNPDLSRLLRILHADGKIIASLCHGPAMLLSAPDRADGQWLFEGYRMTSYTNDEEDQNRIGQLGMTWYLADALQNAGAIFDDAPYAWASHVVVDRNLITGQNPNSTEATSEAVVKALSSASA